MKVGVVGVGAVGASIAKMFPNAVLYDEPKRLGARADLDDCEVVFVCVPTPQAPDGSCDTSIVEEVVSWLKASVICIRSTVSVGTTSRLAEKYNKAIVFQPEYGPAETPDHPFNDLRNIRWIILGGPREATQIVSRAWQGVYNSDIVIRHTTPELAELCKYMENAFLALKVTFCNEFYDISRRLGVEYEELRELWLLDPRVGRSHTFVFPDKRGFGGRCLPKDLEAIIRTSVAANYEPGLLQEVVRTNQRIRAQSS